MFLSKWLVVMQQTGYSWLFFNLLMEKGRCLTSPDEELRVSITIWAMWLGSESMWNYVVWVVFVPKWLVVVLETGYSCIYFYNLQWRGDIWLFFNLLKIKGRCLTSFDDELMASIMIWIMWEGSASNVELRGVGGVVTKWLVVV